MHFKINNTLPSFFFEKKVQYMLLSVEWIFLLSVLWTKYLETDVRTTRHSFAVVYYFSRLLLQTFKLSYLHMINTFITFKYKFTYCINDISDGENLLFLTSTTSPLRVICNFWKYTLLWQTIKVVMNYMYFYIFQWLCLCEHYVTVSYFKN